MKRIRNSGPKGAHRPFKPAIDLNNQQSEGDKISEALEHIAVVLSAIDHNLEVLVERLPKR